MAILVIAIVMDLAFVWFTAARLPVLDLPAILSGAMAVSILSGGLNIWSIGLMKRRVPDLYIIALSLFLFRHALGSAANTSTSHVLLVEVCSIALKIAQVWLLMKAISCCEVDTRQKLVEHFQ